MVNTSEWALASGDEYLVNTGGERKNGMKMAWCLVHWTPSRWAQVRCYGWKSVSPIFLSLSPVSPVSPVSAVSPVSPVSAVSPVSPVSARLCTCAYQHLRTPYLGGYFVSVAAGDV